MNIIMTVPSYLYLYTEPETTEQFHYKPSTTFYELIPWFATWSPESYYLVIQ